MSMIHSLGLFALGGSCYTGLELAWRQRSHISMFFLGGACFLGLGAFDRAHPRMSPLFKLPACAGFITAGEFLTGLMVNRDHRVWDYRNLPWNIQGQICLPFSLLWIPVSGAGILLYRSVCPRKS